MSNGNESPAATLDFRFTLPRVGVSRPFWIRFDVSRLSVTFADMSCDDLATGMPTRADHRPTPVCRVALVFCALLATVGAPFRPAPGDGHGLRQSWRKALALPNCLRVVPPSEPLLLTVSFAFLSPRGRNASSWIAASNSFENERRSGRNFGERLCVPRERSRSSPLLC